MTGSLNERDCSLVFFSVHEPFCLTDEDFVAFIILGSDEDDWFLGFDNIVEDLSCGFHLFFQSSVGNQTHVEHAEESINTHPTLGQETLVKLLLNA